MRPNTIATRDRMVEVAETIIDREGLQALRVRDVAEMAECALGMVSKVFGHVDGLVLAVNGRTLAAMEQALFRKGSPARDRQSADKEIVRLALAYLAFATKNKNRWKALFEHRMAEGNDLPAEYRAETNRLFLSVTAPLAFVCPDLDEARREALSRSIFSAVHGMVSLGLDQKIDTIPVVRLREQIRIVVAAILAGLVCEPER